MKFYHATTPDIAVKIRKEGIIKQSVDGVVYLCKTPEDACKFVYIRGHKEITVICVELDEDEVQESFDHNERFFGCKAYYYEGSIILDDSKHVSIQQFNYL